MRAPLAPIGWPSATAPPFTFTMSSSRPEHPRRRAAAPAANASLISTSAEVGGVEAGLLQRRSRARAPARCAGTGTAPPTSRSATISASGVEAELARRPPRSSRRRRPRRRRSATRCPAVTVPSLAERGLAARRATRPWCPAGCPRRGRTTTGSPLRCGTSTATTSSASAPDVPRGVRPGDATAPPTRPGPRARCASSRADLVGGLAHVLVA